MATTQLRRYEIAPGKMDVFLPYWHDLVRQREAFGFRVVFAYIDQTNNELVWVVEHDGDFAAAEAEYLHSAERAATLAEAPHVMTGGRVGMATRLR